jgi:hypothetical protein
MDLWTVGGTVALLLVLSNICKILEGINRVVLVAVKLVASCTRLMVEIGKFVDACKKICGVKPKDKKRGSRPRPPRD